MPLRRAGLRASRRPRPGGHPAARGRGRRVPAAADAADGRDAAGDRALGRDRPARGLVAGLLLRRQHRRGRVRLPAGRLLPAARLRHGHGDLRRRRHQRGRGRDRPGAGGRPGPCTRHPPTPRRRRARAHAAGRRAVYLAIALSGLSALGAEVVWTRLLSLLLGGTVYTFSIILAVFLVGLGIGSSVGGVPGAAGRTAAGGAGRLPVAPGRGHRLDRVHDRRESLPYWPIVPGAVAEPLVHLPARPGALPLGGPAGGVPVGSELPAGAGGGRLAAARTPAGWSAGSTRPTRSARSSARWPSACCWSPPSARPAANEC